MSRCPSISSLNLTTATVRDLNNPKLKNEKFPPVLPQSVSLNEEDILSLSSNSNSPKSEKINPEQSTFIRDDAKRSSFTLKGRKKDEFENIQQAIDNVRRTRTISDSQCEIDKTRRKSLLLNKNNIRTRAASNKSLRLKHKSTTIGINTQDEICTNIENMDIASYQKQVREIQMLGQFESSRQRQRRFVAKKLHEEKSNSTTRRSSQELKYGPRSFTVSDAYRVASHSTSRF